MIILNDNQATTTTTTSTSPSTTTNPVEDPKAASSSIRRREDRSSNKPRSRRSQSPTATSSRNSRRRRGARDDDRNYSSRARGASNHRSQLLSRSASISDVTGERIARTKSYDGDDDAAADAATDDDDTTNEVIEKTTPYYKPLAQPSRRSKSSRSLLQTSSSTNSRRRPLSKTASNRSLRNSKKNNDESQQHPTRRSLQRPSSMTNLVAAAPLRHHNHNDHNDNHKSRSLQSYKSRSSPSLMQPQQQQYHNRRNKQRSSSSRSLRSGRSQNSSQVARRSQARSHSQEDKPTACSSSDWDGDSSSIDSDDEDDSNAAARKEQPPRRTARSGSSRSLVNRSEKEEGGSSRRSLMVQRNRSRSRRSLQSSNRKSSSSRSLDSTVDDNNDDDNRRAARYRGRQSSSVGDRRTSRHRPRNDTILANCGAGYGDDRQEGDQGMAPRVMQGGVIKIRVLQGRELATKGRDLIRGRKKSSSEVMVQICWNGHQEGWATRFQTTPQSKPNNSKHDFHFDETFELELGLHAMNKLLVDHRGMPNLEFQVFQHGGNSSLSTAAAAAASTITSSSDHHEFLGSVVVNAGKSLSALAPQWHQLQSQSWANASLTTTAAARGELQLQVWVEAMWLPELDRGSQLTLPSPRNHKGLSLELYYNNNNKDDEVDVEVSCVAVDQKGNICWNECVYFAQPSTDAFSLVDRTDCGSRHHPPILRMRLEQVPHHVCAVYYVLHVRHAEDDDATLDDLQVRLLDGVRGLCRYVCPMTTTAQIVLRLARVEDSSDWCLVPVSQHVPLSQDMGTLLPHVKHLSKDLVALSRSSNNNNVINPCERRALLRPGSSVRVVDYSPDGTLPEVLRWSVDWSLGQAKAMAMLLDQHLNMVGSISIDKPNGHGLRHSKMTNDSEAFSISLSNVPSHIQFICMSLCPLETCTRNPPCISIEHKNCSSSSLGSSFRSDDESLTSSDKVRQGNAEIMDWLKIRKLVKSDSKSDLLESETEEDEVSARPPSDNNAQVRCQFHDPSAKAIMGTAILEHSMKEPLLLAYFSRAGASWDVHLLGVPADDDSILDWQIYLQETPLKQAPELQVDSSFTKCSMPYQVPYVYPINFLVTEDSLAAIE